MKILKFEASNQIVYDKVDVFVCALFNFKFRIEFALMTRSNCKLYRYLCELLKA